MNDSISKVSTHSKKLSTFKKVVIPVAILIVTFFLSQIIIKNPPKSNRGKVNESGLITVETLKLSPQTYPVILNSFGTVQPRTKSVLVA